MGSSNSNSSTTNNPGAIAATSRYNQLYGSGSSNPVLDQLGKQQSDFYKRYTESADRQTADYNNIMSGYNNLTTPGARTFTYNPVSSPTPSELNEGYGYMREAVPGYRDFANTGGYSEQDISDLRARGVSPIRAAYANAQQNIERAKAVGGGYAPNYIAATAKMTRDQSQNAADATQNVNARLAEDIRTGKLAGLAGLTGIGGQMGSLSLQDASRILTANLANQNADINTQNLSEQSTQNNFRNQLSGLAGKTSLYSATPGQASMFGNQALSAMGQYLTGMGMDQENAARLLQIMSGNQTTEGKSGPAWWQYALQAAPYAAKAGVFGSGASTAFGGSGSSIYGGSGGLTGLGGGDIAGGIAAEGAGEGIGASSGIGEGIGAGVGSSIGTGVTGAGVGSGVVSGFGGGANTGLTGVGGYAAGIGIPLGIMGLVNSYTGGPSPYSTGSSYNPFGKPAGVTDSYTESQHQQTLQHLMELYGADSPIVQAYMEYGNA